jgi:hypothetical protein
VFHRMSEQTIYFSLSSLSLSDPRLSYWSSVQGH